MPHALEQIPRIRLLTDQEVLNAVVLEQSWVAQPHPSLAVTVVNPLPISIGNIEIGIVGLQNIANAQINPATEETLAALTAQGANGTLQFGTATAVASGANAQVVSFTVPSGKKLHLRFVEASGTNRADFEVRVDAGVIAKKRTYFTGYNVTFFFSDFVVNEGETVYAFAKNRSTLVGDFEANIQGQLV